MCTWCIYEDPGNAKRAQGILSSVWADPVKFICAETDVETAAAILSSDSYSEHTRSHDWYTLIAWLPELIEDGKIKFSKKTMDKVPIVRLTEVLESVERFEMFEVVNRHIRQKTRDTIYSLETKPQIQRAGESDEGLTNGEAAAWFRNQLDNVPTFESAKARVSTACKKGEIKSSGQGKNRRIDKTSLGNWTLKELHKANGTPERNAPPQKRAKKR